MFEHEWVALREPLRESRRGDRATPPRPVRGGLFVERIESAAALRALEPEWRELESRARSTVPFATFDWAWAWWSQLRESKFGVRDKLCARALRAPGGELVGVAPLLLTLRPGFGPVSTRALQFLGADPNITEVRELLVPPGARDEASRTLLRALRDESDGWDWMVWTGPAESDAPGAAVTSWFSRVQVLRDIPEYHLALPPTWAEFKSRLNRNIKESLRRCYNAPKRDGLNFRFDVLRGPEGVGAALGDFFRLHGARAAQDDTIHHNDVFASSAARRFLVQVCERFAQRGALRIFRLFRGDSVVALRIGFVLGDLLYLYYSGYEPEFGKYSVMTTVVAEAIQYAIAEGIRTVNLSTGNDVSKTRWSPREVVRREWLVISPSLRGWMVHRIAGQARQFLQRTRAAGLFARRQGR